MDGGEAKKAAEITPSFTGNLIRWQTNRSNCMIKVTNRSAESIIIHEQFSFHPSPTHIVFPLAEEKKISRIYSRTSLEGHLATGDEIIRNVRDESARSLLPARKDTSYVRTQGIHLATALHQVGAYLPIVINL